MKPILFPLSGVLFAFASAFPETNVSFILCIVTSLLLSIAVLESQKLYRGLLAFSLCFHAIAFYWLAETISRFGGFPSWAAYGVFALFCVTGSFQFLLCGYLYIRLRRTTLDRLFLSFPIAWGVSAYVVPRLFPWELAHCMITWKSFAGVAEFVGVPLLSVLLLWWGSAVVGFIRDWRADLLALKNYAPVSLVTILVLALGVMRNSSLHQELDSAPRVKMGLVQGNLELIQKRDIAFFKANIEQYQKLSKVALEQGAKLLLWPESVSNRWMPEKFTKLKDTEFDPLPFSDTPIVFGGLSFTERPYKELKEILFNYPQLDIPQYARRLRFLYYNAAIALDAQKEVMGRYYKKVLMPFGEYIPFSSWYPPLKFMIPAAGDFTSGRRSGVVSVPIEDNLIATLGILICYEDLIPSLSYNSAARGAQVLVNLTNDAWYGDTSAPYQHHLLAQWRAIETRRYLLRVTNTGFTAVVDPFGKTLESLPLFEEGVIVRDVPLLHQKTWYMWLGEWLNLGAVLLGVWCFWCGVKRGAVVDPNE